METEDFQKSLCLTTLVFSCAPQCYHSFQKNHMGLVSCHQESDQEAELAKLLPRTLQIYKVYNLPQIMHTGLKYNFIYL